MPGMCTTIITTIIATAMIMTMRTGTIILIRTPITRLAR